ncbi:MAG: MEDS domain-containing protein [Vicinamibacterales bacterium]
MRVLNMDSETANVASLELDDRFIRLSQGSHVCAVYTSPAEQAAATVRYIRSGIAAGERAMYIADDCSGAEIRERLGLEGIDVGAAEASGRLLLPTTRDRCLRDGQFVPSAMVEFLRDAQRDALASGCAGLRVTGEMTWTLGADVDSERLMDYEDGLNRWFPGSRSQAICQYNRSRFKPAVVRDVLRTHPIAVIAEQVCPNPFYEPPHLVDAADSHAARAEWMISQLVQLREHELKLKEAITARDEFLSVAAHELRTPLHALNLAVRSLPSSGERHMETDRVVRQVQRLNRLIDVAFDVSRLRERQHTLVPEPCDLRELVEQVVGRFDLEAAHAGSPVCIDVPQIVGVWDHYALDHILSYLLSNALKYGPGQPIDVGARRQNGHVVLHVRDRGIGIPREDRHRIFERFERAATFTGTPAGFGLGLWVVRETATAMGGDVQLVDVEGPGSAFEVTLPIAPADQTRH